MIFQELHHYLEKKDIKLHIFLYEIFQKKLILSINTQINIITILHFRVSSQFLLNRVPEKKINIIQIKYNLFKIRSKSSIIRNPER